MNRTARIGIRFWVYSAVIGVPFLLVALFFLGPIGLIEIEAQRDLTFVRHFRVNGQTIEQRIGAMSNVARYEWEAGELGTACKLFFPGQPEYTAIFFVRRNDTVYASSQRTADLFPELPKADMKGMSYDDFGGKIGATRPNQAL